jgi:uncharacterized 2Fe-2S/4Fe-4S cluster protein (DUF4445 family)
VEFFPNQMAEIGRWILALLKEAGLEVHDLQKVYVAGSFGCHLDLENASVIGLLPDIEPNRIQAIGNACLGGASCGTVNLIWRVNFGKAV